VVTRHVVAATLVLAAACSRAGGVPAIDLVDPPGDAPPRVTVTGLSAAELRALGSARLDAEGWQAVLRVEVAGAGDDDPAIAGRYSIAGAALDFRPAFPFDPGRTYVARVDRGQIPGGSAAGTVERSFSLPAPDRTPTAEVSAVYPSGDVWPENLLRVYVEFSTPMSRASGVDHVRLFDERGVEVVDPFLPLDVDLWNSDFTRYTLFLDPGRVKRGILPHERLGRAIRAGGTYTVEVSTSWRDAHGQPLRRSYRRTVHVSAPDEHAVTPAEWRIDAPRAGTRDPLVVSFPDALDHGLLQRALVVHRVGESEPLAGAVDVGTGETLWRFLPDASWSAGDHDLLVHSILEDPAGNRVGRLFEVVHADEEEEEPPQPDRVTRRFTIAVQPGGTR
jgi:hypothetical protein